MAETKKPASTGSSEIKPANPFKAWFPYIVIVVVFILCEIFFYSSSGISNPKNFEGGEDAYAAWNAAEDAGKNPEEEGIAHWTEGNPVSEPGSRNLLGLLRHGGLMIPIGLTLQVILVIFYERSFRRLKG